MIIIMIIIKKKKKKQLSFLLSEVVSIYQDIQEQRLPWEPSGGVSQSGPVHLPAAPERQVGVHRSLCAASSLRSGW